MVNLHGFGCLDQLPGVIRVHLAQLPCANEVPKMTDHFLMTLVSDRVAMHQLRVKLLHVQCVGRAVAPDPILALHRLLANKVIARNTLTPLGEWSFEGP